MKRVMRLFSRRGRWAAALVVLCGCGGGSPSADRQAARAALESALESWRKGEEPGALEQARPSIHVSDWRRATGVKLGRFEIGDDRAFGTSQRFKVRLWIESAKGKTRFEPAEYDVVDRPEVVVARVGDR